LTQWPSSTPAASRPRSKESSMYNHADRRQPTPFWPIFLGLLVGWTLPLAVSAESSNLAVAPAPPPAPPAHLVRELLEQDARRALLTEQMADRSKSGSARSPLSTALPEMVRANVPDEPIDAPAKPAIPATVTRSKATVGVAASLSAIVEVDGRKVVYRAGQALPAGGDDDGPRRARIDAPTVALAAATLWS